MGSVPVMYLYRHTYGDREFLYFSSPRMSHPVKSIEEADKKVMQMLQTPKPQGNSRPQDGFRVTFVVGSVAVLPTSDIDEFHENPVKIGAV